MQYIVPYFYGILGKGFCLCRHLGERFLGQQETAHPLSCKQTPYVFPQARCVCMHVPWGGTVRGVRQRICCTILILTRQLDNASLVLQPAVRSGFKYPC